MAAVTKVCFLHLLLIAPADFVFVREPIHLFVVQGKESQIRSLCTGGSYALFYRSSPAGDRFIFNASFLQNLAEFVVANATQADSGDYYVECWNQGNVTAKEEYNMVVCAEEVSTEDIYLPYGATVDFELKDFNFTQGDTLHIYSVETAFSYWGDHFYGSLILNTSDHLETLDVSLRFGVQVLANSTIRISAKRGAFVSDFFFHTWSGNVCRMRQTVQVYLGYKTLFLKHGQSITLECLVQATEHQSIDWNTPHGYVVSFFKNYHKIGTAKILREMYMVNGSHTRNYSLVIPFVGANTSGEYSCVDAALSFPTWYPFEKTTIYVCADLDPINKTFSRGSRVVFVCDMSDFNHTKSIRVQWYRQTGASEEELILEHNSEQNILAYIPVGLQGKVNSTSPQAYLAMSNLSPEDNGVYRCKVWGRFAPHSREKMEFCSERRINLEYKDTFAIDSAFYCIYASMMGCGLLAMMCAVVCMAMKNRVKQLPRKS